MSGLIGGKTQGSTEPRLGAMNIQTSVYGMCIPLVYGANRISPNLIWYGDFQSQAVKQNVGGKGGGGANSSYDYHTAMIMALCEGPIINISGVWVGGNQLQSYTDSHGTVYTPLAQLGFGLYGGIATQTPWGYLTTNHPDQALSYACTAYLAASYYDLGNTASLPNHNFEIYGLQQFNQINTESSIIDACPADVLVDFLTNAQYGAGFPSAKIGDMTQFRNYTIASGLFVSPAYTSQQAAQQSVDDLLSAVNCALVFSGGVLKVIPYGDIPLSSNGASYTPNLTPVYDLTDDDFIGTDDPIKVTRTRDADAYNSVQIEYLDRANHYNVAIMPAKDIANIELYGIRSDSPQQAHMICDAGIAAQVAQIRLQRLLYIRNQYEFTLGWKYCLLEPMDIVTLNDDGLGLDQYPVRILSITENEDGSLDVKAEELLVGTASALTYNYQSNGGYSGQEGNPGDVNAPFIFEPPLVLTTNGSHEVWAAVSGGNNWSGCHVWAAFSGDGGAPGTYKMIGVVEGVSRYGTLQSDSGTSIQVTLNTGAQLYSGTTLDATSGQTLCYIDGELLSYETATLTGTNQYTLGNLHRGQYGTIETTHAPSDAFARVDGQIFKYPYDKSLIGTTISLKFTSFNSVLGMEQALSEVEAYSYALSGGAPQGPADLALQSPWVGLSFTTQWSGSVGADSYNVNVVYAGTTIRTVSTTSTQFTYAISDAQTDGAIHRAYTIDVESVAGGQSSGYSQLLVSNPVPPELTSISTSSSTSAISISWGASPVTDLQDYAVWISTTNGFDPTSITPSWVGTATGTAFTGLASGTTYYLVACARDQWGSGNWNYSAQYTVTTTT